MNSTIMITIRATALPAPRDRPSTACSFRLSIFRSTYSRASEISFSEPAAMSFLLKRCLQIIQMFPEHLFGLVRYSFSPTADLCSGVFSRIGSQQQCCNRSGCSTGKKCQ